MYVCMRLYAFMSRFYQNQRFNLVGMVHFISTDLAHCCRSGGKLPSSLTSRKLPITNIYKNRVAL